MFKALLPPLLLALVVALRLAAAQEINSALGPAPTSRTIFDEINDAPERRAFRQVWDASDPHRQQDLAAHFVEQYPRSVVLREAYELAARASVASGDLAAGLDWAARSLRLLPENPSLLVMVADSAAKRGDLDRAESSARDALGYLANAEAPPLVSQQWPRVRNELRAAAHTVLGRVAATRERYADAESTLTTALALNSDEMEAAYLLGIVRTALGDDHGAASPLAHVVRSQSALAGPAREWLRRLYDRGTDRSTMTFEQYAASLSWTPPVSPASAPVAATSHRYAGSTTCRDCHRRVYERWQGTGMAKMFRPYRPEDVIGEFSGQTTVSDRARPLMVGDRHVIEIKKGDSGEWVRYPVDYVIGSKWQQAYATSLSDGRFLVFPIQYSRLDGSWLNYWKVVDAPGSPRTDIARFHEVPEDAVYQSTCAPCHTSQLKVGQSDKTMAATFREGGINCEMCHGPSLSHVEAKRAGTMANAETPLRFGRLAPSESVAICAQCHSQSALHAAEPGGAVNYSDGPAWQRMYPTHLLSSFSRTAFYRDGRFRATTFISEAFARTQCFRKGGATCVSCHDPHPPDAATNPTSLRFGRDADEMCLQCHTSLREAPTRHTRHLAGTEASRCVSCHMPKIAEALLFKARSHEIDDVPDVAMTERFGPDDSPNACLSCHSNRDVGWLRSAMAARLAGR